MTNPPSAADPQPVIQSSPSPVIRQKLVKPTVTYVLIGLCVALFIAQYVSELLTGYDFLFLFGGKINEYILKGQLWRLFTPMLLHGSITHLAFNMYALYSIGSSLEKHFGHLRFSALFIAGGFGGNVLSFLLSPNPSLGSSTAIFGLLAAEGVFIYQNRKFFGNNARRMITNTVTIAAINLFFGFSIARIDNFGHLGGLFAGLIFTFIASPIWKIQGFYPNFEIIDESPTERIWLGLAASLGVFSVLAFLKMTGAI
jgi:rhomboid protease GluP